MRAPLAPPRLSEPRKVDADAQAVETNCGNGEPESEDLRLEGRDVRGSDQRVVDGGNRILPDQRLLGNERAEIARDRPHVAVGELEPRPRECVGELVRVLKEAP